LFCYAGVSGSRCWFLVTINPVWKKRSNSARCDLYRMPGVVNITKVESADGKIFSLSGEFVPDGDFKSCKRKLSWMTKVSNNATAILTEFDHLVTKEKLEETDKFEDFVNDSTIATTTVMGDAGLKMLQQHDVIQLERRGFYRVDRPFISNDKPAVLYMIPDGKSKSMSGLAGKLAHH
jgi:glutamyl-tRNA synthetase